ncbi:carbohydrate esterase family 5 protein [Zopfia rhizophila CBS 207.26]|uniref:Cutinase n=1 Tax=Zopfia rhizophila CBS 207.26 TaxID=1314779 RepID=A0A6A6DCR1_9PEZI|nr:carbohydrate esterase family 5 protein [Zopfia rhizophila CBS 207.26]
MYFNAFVTAALVGLATSSPIAIDADLSKRQTRTTANEFIQGGCRDIIFAWARGSTEAGNMGTIVGPPISDGLKAEFGNNAVATEGIDYPALLSTNALPGGADPIGINDMRDVLTRANRQCPDSILVAGGYSQGAAVCHRAIENLPQNVKDQIAGVVTYGDTQKQQDNNQIPNFPREKVEIICNPGDLVCEGTLTVLPPHLAYGVRAGEGVNFLSQQIRGAQAGAKARKVKTAMREMARIVT